MNAATLGLKSVPLPLRLSELYLLIFADKSGAWAFPGRHFQRPLSPAALSVWLKRYGVTAPVARVAARFPQATELNPRILSDAIEISASTETRFAWMSGGTWNFIPEIYDNHGYGPDN